MSFEGDVTVIMWEEFRHAWLCILAPSLTAQVPRVNLTDLNTLLPLCSLMAHLENGVKSLPGLF